MSGMVEAEEGPAVLVPSSSMNGAGSNDSAVGAAARAAGVGGAVSTEGRGPYEILRRSGGRGVPITGPAAAAAAGTGASGGGVGGFWGGLMTTLGVTAGGGGGGRGVWGREDPDDPGRDPADDGLAAAAADDAALAAVGQIEGAADFLGAGAAAAGAACLGTGSAGEGRAAAEVVVSLLLLLLRLAFAAARAIVSWSSSGRSFSRSERRIASCTNLVGVASAGGGALSPSSVSLGEGGRGAGGSRGDGRCCLSTSLFSLVSRPNFASRPGTRKGIPSVYLFAYSGARAPARGTFAEVSTGRVESRSAEMGPDGAEGVCD
ncbi:hypothetical protein PENTCL1PPCAC_25294, partial [Pristionchus entomophagus]